MSLAASSPDGLMQPLVRHWQSLQQQFAAQWGDRAVRAALSTATEELVAAQQAFGAEHPAVVRALLDLGLALQANGQPEESRTMENDAQALVERLRRQAEASPDDPRTADLWLFDADRLWNLVGGTAPVVDLYARSIALREKLLGPDHPDTAQAVARLAEVEDLRARFAEAEPLYRRAIAGFEAMGESEDPYVEKSLEGLGRVLLQLGRPAEAWPYLERALAWAERYGYAKRALYFLLMAATQCRRALGDTTGAAAWEARAVALLPKANPGAEGFHV